MTRTEKEKAAKRRHKRAMKDGASWYFYLYYKILRSRGCGHSQALMKAIKRHPGVFGICEPTASTNSNASAAARLRAASAAQSVRTADASYALTGVKNADTAGV
jgi:hypothetical protein